MLSASKLSKLAVVATLALGVASCDDDSTDRGPLVKVRVNPDNVLVERGTIRRYHLEGVYRDGSYEVLTSGVTWESLDPTVATIDADGLVEGVTVGEARIEGTYGRFVDTTIVNVTPAVDFVQLFPQRSSVIKGLRKTFTVYAVMEDRAIFDVTGDSTFAVSDATIASISGNRARGLKGGAVTVTATYRDQAYTTQLEVVDTNITAIELTAEPDIPVGYRGWVQAIGTLDPAVDGEDTVDLSSRVTFELANPNYGTISRSGARAFFIPKDTLAAKGQDDEPGQVELKATFQQLSDNPATEDFNEATAMLEDSVILTIKPRSVKLTSVEMSPAAITIAPSLWDSVSVTGTFSRVAADGTKTFDSTRDISAEVSCSTNNSSVAYVTGNGVRGKTPGQAMLYLDKDLDKDGSPDGSATITVVEPAISSAVIQAWDSAAKEWVPAAGTTVSAGETLFISLDATYTSGDVFNPLVTWVSSAPAMAMAGNGDYAGSVIAVGNPATSETVTIEAWVRGQKVAEADITVNAAP